MSGHEKRGSAVEVIKSVSERLAAHPDKSAAEVTTTSVQCC